MKFIDLKDLQRFLAKDDAEKALSLIKGKSKDKISNTLFSFNGLPRELLGMIAVCLFSVIELKSFRSVCRSWRSSAFDNPFRSRPLIELKLLDPTENASQQGNAFLSGAAFFRVTPSSSPNQGWLIKSDTDLNSGKFRLLDHFSRIPLKHRCKSINLLRFNVSEIQEAYVVHDRRMDEPDPGFKRVVLATVQGGDHALGVGWDGRIRFWSGRIWTILKDQLAEFTDVVIHGGLTYALASDGSVWWISSSLSIFKYGPPLDESITEGDTLDPNVFYVCAVDDDGNQIGETSPKTIGFKVYKMDEDMGKWVEVKSLGDDAFVMATDTCFSVSAGEFHGCLKNAIYFADKECKIRVFKLEDASITRVTSTEQNCFKMSKLHQKNDEQSVSALASHKGIRRRTRNEPALTTI
ncbi:unnamed protein product [Thlaspi arvense]|uniref:F-box domain-containing protein n=1 Tax=Thlaspi arvense TaxID=13288 RepID=A0AAU9RU02_THLAR|nr:unnamed protein product [Thlaspi arvense]